MAKLCRKMNTINILHISHFKRVVMINIFFCETSPNVPFYIVRQVQFSFFWVKSTVASYKLNNKVYLLCLCIEGMATQITLKRGLLLSYYLLYLNISQLLLISLKNYFTRYCISILFLLIMSCEIIRISSGISKNFRILNLLNEF